MLSTANITIQESNKKLTEVRGSANLADLVKSLNAIGASPKDLIAILQAIKEAGALNADLEVL